MAGPDYLTSYLLAFFVGLFVARSSIVRSKLIQLSRFVAKSSEESQLSKVAEITQSRDSSEPEILDKYQVEKQFSDDTWERQAYNAFGAKLSSKEKIFPCIYASKGFKDNDLRYMFLPTEDASERRNVLSVARALLTYIPSSHECGLNTSLVILTPNSQKKRTVEDYHKIFWTFLKSLRQIDPKPWPSNISEETMTNRWCFCFNGKPSFLAVLAPAFEKRQSRHLPNFAIVYQPRWVFELLLTTDAKRESALNHVRGLIDKYDYPLPHSPDISNFGEEGCSEAKEYFIYDENRPAVCPWPTLLAP